MDFIFEIGIFMIPFENLFFAPSAGWATITPIIFLIYVLINIKEALRSIFKYKNILFFILIGILLSLINYLFVGIESKNFINASISLGLGIINLLSIDIYFRKKNNKIDKVIKILLISYGISLFIGILQFISIKFDLDKLKNFFILLEKRSYIKYNRVQFTFTEPSFIGMHMFGILLPFFYYTKNKKIIKLIIVFVITSIIFSSGLRILVDTVVCMLIYILTNIKSKKNFFTIILMLIIAFITIPKIYNSNYRVREIIDAGIYADRFIGI